MKKIALGGKPGTGKFALVDDEDYEELSKYKWHIAGGYATRTGRRQMGGSQRSIFMHRTIMVTPNGMYTDHINGNVLDNRKSNLRICTKYENSCNRKLNKNNSTGAKGVRIVHKKTDNICARIRVKNKLIYLGSFKTVRAAARAYNIAALKYHGEFACLNTIK